MTTRRRKFSERSAVDRSFVSGFVLGYCLGRHERGQELEPIEREMEDAVEQARADVGKAVAEIRAEWGLADPDRTKVTVQ